MPTFKPKTTKKIVDKKKAQLHLTQKHSNEQMESFSKDEKKIKELEQEERKLSNKLRKQQTPKNGAKLEQYLDKIDKKKDLRKDVARLKKIEKSIYMLDNSKYIFDYFENKKKVSEGESDSQKIQRN